MSCDISGYPAPAVEWFCDGKIVTESRSLRLYFDGVTATLKIYEAATNHEGEYTCKARSTAGSVETKAHLFVEEVSDATDLSSLLPKFVRKMEDHFVAESDQAVFSVMVTGKPRPEVTWLFNGQPLVKDDNVHRLRSWDDGSHTLELLQITHALCGVYTCKATNASGTTHCSATLGIVFKGDKGIEGQPAGFISTPPKTLTVNEGEPIVLQCEVKGQPKPRGNESKAKCIFRIH